MKRLFILASAAIVALASCTKTEVVYNEAPQEIGFKAVTGVMTKAPITDATFPGDQGITVSAWNYRGKAAYFGPTVFSKAGNVWNADPAQYYPTIGSLDFVAYTDMATPVITAVNNSNESYTYTLSDNSTNQHDFMVSEYVVNNESSANAVGMEFSHALALIEINVACTGQAVTVNSVSLAGTYQNGEVNVTYTDADTADENVDPIIGDWDLTGATTKTLTKRAAMSLTPSVAAENYAYFLVVPEDNEEDKILTVEYTLNGNTFAHPIDLSDYDATTWQTGKKYIFNITIGLQQISFAPSIGTDWGTGNTVSPTI